MGLIGSGFLSAQEAAHCQHAATSGSAAVLPRLAAASGLYTILQLGPAVRQDRADSSVDPLLSLVETWDVVQFVVDAIADGLGPVLGGIFSFFAGP